jgi:DNA polymerase-1
MPTNILAIDTMNLLVRAYHGGTPTHQNGVRLFFRKIRELLDLLKPIHIVFADEGGPEHRRTIYREYKQSRKDRQESPFLKDQIALTRDIIRTLGYPLIRCDGWEADDVLASLATQHTDCVVVSTDKDMLALADRARIYDPWDKRWLDVEYTWDRWRVGPHQMVDLLGLMGDASDGIPGIRGVGPATAANLIREWGGLAGAIEAARLGKIPGKIGERLVAEAEVAMTSYSLATLRSGLDVRFAERVERQDGYEDVLHRRGAFFVLETLGPWA